MAWFRKKVRFTKLPENDPAKRREMPVGVWTRCDNCEEYITNDQYIENLYVCPHCGDYRRITARQRVEILVDPNSFEELDAELRSCDPLGFDGYADKLTQNQNKTGLTEAIIAGWAKIRDRKCSLAVIDFSFMGASMGSVVGEKVTRAAERALEARLPLLVISASGGARMQEGMLSLMQMAKTSAAVARLREQCIPFISLMTNPTTAGVAASFAALGDVIVSEPRARIGFAGPRVIEQTIGQRLPDGFQTAEFLLDHGMIDMIVSRHDLPTVLANLMNHLCTKLDREQKDQQDRQPISAVATS